MFWRFSELSIALLGRSEAQIIQWRRDLEGVRGTRPFMLKFLLRLPEPVVRLLTLVSTPSSIWRFW